MVINALVFVISLKEGFRNILRRDSQSRHFVYAQKYKIKNKQTRSFKKPALATFILVDDHPCHEVMSEVATRQGTDYW